MTIKQMNIEYLAGSDDAIALHASGVSLGALMDATPWLHVYLGFHYMLGFRCAVEDGAQPVDLS